MTIDPIGAYKTKQDYLDAKTKVREASEAYYLTGETLLTDAEYDVMLMDIAATEDVHADWIEGDDKVSTQVASGADVSGDVEHKTPMLSLDNVFSVEALEKWFNGINETLGEKTRYIVEPKLDGLSLSVRYEDGEPVQLVTRGDGQFGEDVTYALTGIENIPTGVKFSVPSYMGGGISTRDIRTEAFSGEVRGEVIFSREQFEEANRLRRTHGDKEFMNPRNGAVGTLRGASSRAYVIPLTFVAFDVHFDAQTGFDMHYVAMNELHKVGFRTALSVIADGTNGKIDKVAGSSVEVTELISLMEDRVLRDGLDFGTDGMVIKIDSVYDRSGLGVSSRAPKWAIAYKFPQEEVTSTLEEVLWQVGRTGAITPRARITPVEVDGTVITYTTLHNPDDIRRKGFMLGDKVAVVRAGQVIPRLEYPLVGARTGDETEIAIPDVCPNCGSEIDYSEVRLRCSRGRNCQADRVIEYAVSRDALDIDGLGATQVKAMVNSGLVNDIADLFTLTVDQIASLPSNKKPYSDTPANVKADRVGLVPPIGQTTAKKIVAEIEKSRNATLAKWVTALAIRGTGRTMSKRLAKDFGSLDALRAASLAEVEAVEGIGDVKAQGIVDELLALTPTLDALKAHGIDPVNAAPKSPVAAVSTHVVKGDDDDSVSDEVTVSEVSTDALSGMKIVVTGSMKGVLEGKSRADMVELIEGLGGTFGSSISKNVDLLVVGANAGATKLGKAEGLGVRMVSEDEFADMIGL